MVKPYESNDNFRADHYHRLVCWWNDVDKVLAISYFFF